MKGHDELPGERRAGGYQRWRFYPRATATTVSRTGLKNPERPRERDEDYSQQTAPDRSASQRAHSECYYHGVRLSRSARREEFIRETSAVDVGRLVFIDKSGCNIAMSSSCGWGPRLELAEIWLTNADREVVNRIHDR
jgi:hypothetical protein